MKSCKECGKEGCLLNQTEGYCLDCPECGVNWKEKKMELYKNEDLCIECKNEFFSKPYDHRDPTPGQLGYCIKCDNCLIKDKEKKMEFDRSRIYSAVNADELRAGDKVIVANSLSYLRHCVECDECMDEIVSILSDDNQNRFLISGSRTFALAYLVERAENCTNCGEGRWDAEHKKILCDPVNCGNGNVVFRNHEIEVCEYYKPITEQKAEKHYRPFKDTDELIKVWNAKIGIPKSLQIDGALTKPYIWVRRKEANTKGQLITEFGDGWGVGIGRGESYNMTDLWVHFTFLDGSPCGVEE